MHTLTTSFILASWARMQPETLAVIDGHSAKGLTYHQLNQQSAAVATRLKTLGLGSKDVIAYFMTNGLGIVTMLFAVGKLGAAWTPLNPRATLPDWIRQIDHSEAVAVVYDACPNEQLSVLQSALPDIKLWLSWDQLSMIEDNPTPIRSTQIGGWDQRAGLLYTSGTTGLPKGAWHTHQTLWGWNYSLLQSLGMHRKDRLINPYPLFHMGGIGFTLAAIQAGATVVLETPFNARHFAESVLRFNGTRTFMVPTMVQALLDLPAQAWSTLRDSSLRNLVSTSAPLMTETGRDLRRAWPNLVTSVLYSATEAIYSLLNHAQQDKDLCVGRPAFGSEIRILDTDGQQCSQGTLGTIYVRGFSVMAGYHRAPGQFGAWHKDWFTSNDVGYLDTDGYLYLADRAKDLINSGGEKISSLEIENVLRAHPGVKEVGVVGVPDRYWGEYVHAAVVRRDPSVTHEQLLAFAEQRLPRFKIPKSLTFMKELPKTDTGKILKRALVPKENLPPMAGNPSLDAGDA